MMDKSSRYTPYDTTYPTCERTYVSLRIYSSTITPDLISQQLGLTPTDYQTKGEKRFSRRRVGHLLETKLSGWFLSSENEVASNDVRAHLDWLLARLDVASDRLLALQEWSDIKMAIHCIWWSAHGQGGPTLWPEQMEKMAKMNLEFTLDVSFFGEEDEEPRLTIS